MDKKTYKKLRDKTYKVVGEVGSLAEELRLYSLDDAYSKMSQGLDYIDELGVKLGYIDPETNDFK